MEAPLEEFSCQTSLAAGEPLWAHATRVDRWVVLGYDWPWQAKALAFSDLSKPVKEKLISLQKEGPNARVQFIRQPDREPEAGIPLFLARSDAREPWLTSLELDDYRDLLDLDLQGILDGDPPERVIDQPIFLICVNGRRDLCCARNGQPVFESFAQIAPNRTWQTTHLGGHRFAATEIVLPFGLHYGRLGPEDAASIVERADAGRIVLDRFRGRTIHGQPAQAAAYQLRREFELDGIHDLQLVSEVKTGAEEWLIRVRIAGRKDPIARRVRPSSNEFRVIKTTGDEQPANVRHFEVMAAE